MIRMFLFFTFDKLTNFFDLIGVDYLLFTEFEKTVITLLCNIFFLGFLSFVLSIVLKTVSRLLRGIF